LFAVWIPSFFTASKSGIRFPVSDFTVMLQQIESGDSRAADRLLPLVYDELRKLAAQKLSRETPGQTLASMDKIPVAGLVLLVGIDRFVNAARAVTNLIGNGIATIVVARWEKAFDEKRASAMLDGAANESPTEL
jgi:hypothetical protein